MSGMRDEFLSEEDLDLRHLSDEELHAYWDLWLEQAQVTNDMDEASYSRGVFTAAPPRHPPGPDATAPVVSGPGGGEEP